MTPAAVSASTAWPLPRLLRASLGWHVAVLGTAVLVPDTALWALGGIALNHGAIAAAGLLPRCHWLGTNLTRLPAEAAACGWVALTFDDGPDPAVTPRVLDLLDAAGQRASFFCIADRVRAYPLLAREIVARGHSIQNHTARHRHDFAFLGPRAYAAEIARAQAIVQDVTGTTPTCFRAPAGLRNPFLAPVLHRMGLALVSWTRRGFDTRSQPADAVLARLAGNRLAGGDILLLHDGHAGRTPQGTPLVLDVLPRLLSALEARQLRSVTLPQAMSVPIDA
ncbi:MAG: polysaccharide deacetylase family protein [Pseudomonadota bacterium]